MRFCDNCGSRMNRTKQGYECPRCKTTARGDSGMQHEIKGREPPNHIYVLKDKTDNSVKVTQECPECGNKKAYRWFVSISGEHAGTRREATIAHFKCTECSFSWTRDM